MYTHWQEAKFYMYSYYQKNRIMNENTQIKTIIAGTNPASVPNSVTSQILQK